MASPQADTMTVEASSSGMSTIQAARQTDASLGITEYVGSHEGFSGTMKYRFTDFIVREVGTDKKVVRLTDLSAEAASRPAAASSNSSAEAGAGGDAAGEEREETLKAAVGDEQAEKILKLESSIKDASEGAPAAEMSVVLAPETDKAKRTAVHQVIRKHYPLLNTDSVKVEERTCVRVFSSSHLNDAFTRGDRGGGDRGGGPPNKKRKGAGGKALYQGNTLSPGKKYCSFTLFKENMDTMTAINLLSKLLYVAPKAFGYAGTKDKRAATTQRVTVQNVAAGKLANLNLRSSAVGNFEYVDAPLKLGDLAGNRFLIILRDVAAPEPLVASACSSLAQSGFINYYGKQRFGSTSIGTHQIGLAVLKSDWAEACRLILCPRAGEKEEQTMVREGFEASGDVAAALKAFPFWMNAERVLLEGYRKHGKDKHKEAFTGITRNLRLMYVHAWQSFVFNKVASERIKRYGHTKAVEGDLVLEEGEEDTTAGEDAEAGGGGGGGRGSDGKDGKDAWNKEHPKKVKVLSKEEAEAASIFDVVLPLPGMSMQYPANEMRKTYEELVQEAGLDLADMRHNVRDYQLQGDYRRVISRPEGLEWSVLTYTSPRANLVAHDMDLLGGRTDDEIVAAANVEEGEPRRALRLEFTLKSSNYATVCLREILKEYADASMFGLANAPPPPPPPPPLPQRPHLTSTAVDNGLI